MYNTQTIPNLEFKYYLRFHVRNYETVVTHIINSKVTLMIKKTNKKTIAC